ncbi:hypothetical protein FRB96_003970 [Tulasnella sp. 330]|nr:hypothetical protein FRB96_003970 [Tulasnella sp. 330]KAG8875342.1 hypothetical protein FRB97_005206 [Tulasnella sp. 331]KAG8880292.1 hypothetical protein FRB98_005205 [Tulasnella sp. 332]
MTTSELLNSLVELLQSSPPAFVFVHNPSDAVPAPDVHIFQSSLSANSTFRSISIDAVECYASRMLYTTIINQLASHIPEYNSKGYAECFSGTDRGPKWDSSWDGFLEAFRDIYDRMYVEHDGQEKMVGRSQNIALVIKQAKRLKQNLPELFAPLVRFRELAGLPVTVILVSSAPWEELSPAFYTSPCPDPYVVRLLAQTKEDFIQKLSEGFRPPTKHRDIITPLFTTFLGILFDSCMTYTNQPSEIAFMAHAMWPVFIGPVLEDIRAKKRKSSHVNSEGNMMMEEVVPETDAENDASTLAPTPPLGSQAGSPSLAAPEEYTLPPSATPILIRHFLRTFPQAFAALHDRTISPARLLQLQASSFRPSLTPQAAPTAVAKTNIHLQDQLKPKQEAGSQQYPRRTKLMLVAGYIASFNPPRTDLRMFGRMPDGLSRKKRKGGGWKSKGPGRKTTAAKVPQVLLGPNNFTLERFLALYGALIVEHGDGADTDSHSFFDSESRRPGEVEVEVHRAGILMMVSELIQLRLFHRIGSASDVKIDNSMMLKCNVNPETAEKFAKEMGFNLHELLWDPAV